MPAPRRTLRSKFIAVASVGIIAGLGLSVAVSVGGARTISRRSSDEIERGIKETSEAYLRIQIDAVGSAMERILGTARSDVDVLTDFSQALVDRQDELAPVFETIHKSGALRHQLDLDPRGLFRETRRHDGGDPQAPGAPTSLGLWKYLLDSAGNVRPEVEQSLSQTALHDLLLPAIQRNGASKVHTYFVGPKDMPYIRMAEWTPMCATSEKLYPGCSEKYFWQVFFPGLVEGWEELLSSRERFDAHARDHAFLQPYEDSAGAGTVITVFRPLWTKDRKAFAGAMGVDISLTNIIQNIETVRVARSGFAFLAQSDGNVLAINDAGVRALRLRGSDSGQGVKLRHLKLEESGAPEVAALKGALSQGDHEARFRVVSIDREEYVVALKRHAQIDMWAENAGIKPESWTLGLAVPKRELYAALLASQKVIAQTNASVVTAQVGITLATLVAVLLGIALVARRMTAPLSALTGAAQKLEAGRYEVNVSASTDDEIGELAGAFSAMAAKVREHTENLETLVKERTAKLDRALAELWSEMDLAKKIQTVLLPDDAKLGEHDIAARMIPAANVGGDYYDFFPTAGGAWALIGDVSGHGVKSGLIMMMAQTAVRATVLGKGGAAADLSPSRVLSTVNASIRSNLEKIGKGQYMTICALRVERDAVQHAGLHQDILVYRAEKRAVERIETSGVWLGVVDDIAPLLEDARFSLAAGDVALLFTDGVIDAKVDERRLGQETLERLLGEVAPTAESSRAVIDRILERLGTDAFEDDVTLMAIRRCVPGPSAPAHRDPQTPGNVGGLPREPERSSGSRSDPQTPGSAGNESRS